MGNQKRIQIVGDSNLIVNWMNGKWKINNQKFRKMVQRAENAGQGGSETYGCSHGHGPACLQIMEPRSRLFDLTHVAREKGVTWNSQAMGKGERIEAVRF